MPVELRGAGAGSRQVNNFAPPAAFETDKLIACEVITPSANWSSYPPHKHDEASETESVLEEVYYYRFRVRPEAVRRPSAGGYGWIKQAWQGMEIDPRLPFYLPPDSPEPAHTPHGGTR